MPRINSPHGIIPDENWNNPFNILNQYTDGVGLTVYAGFNPITGRDDWGLWSNKFPDPWVAPIDIACEKYSGIKKVICKIYYKCLIRGEGAKISACRGAYLNCETNCYTVGMWPDKEDYLTICIKYCQAKLVHCSAKK